MKLIVSIILTALLSFIGGLWFPWWCIAPASFLVAMLLDEAALKSFFGGFLGVFVLWGVLAWWIDLQNRGILSAKIALILPLNGNSFLLILVTAFVGGLVAGCSAITGSLLRSATRAAREG